MDTAIKGSMDNSITANSADMSSGSDDSAMEMIRRVGYGAKGTLYAILGILAVASAVGAGSESLGFKDAINWVASQSYGTILLVVLIGGIAAYSLYRLVCAFFDAEGVGSDKKGIAKRIGYLGSSLAYASLAFYAGSLIAGSSSGGDSKQDMVATMLQSDAGTFFLGLVAVGLFAAAFAQLYKAWTGKYKQMFDMSELPRKTTRFVNFSAKFGLTARAVIFGLIGYSLFRAVSTSDASEAGGMEKAFSWLGSGAASSWMFGLVALGLVGYALYAFAISYCGRRRNI